MENIHIEPKELGIELFGILKLTDTLLTAFIASAILIIFALIVRIYFIPRFKEKAGKLQTILEMSVNGIQVFTDGIIGKGAAKSIAPYIFTIASFLILNGVLELFGLRPTMTDLNSTIALALISFILIQVYSLKKKGLMGRIRHYKPYYIAPIKVITDLAVPVSLSLRLFGNILGGMIVMELIYSLIYTKWIIPAFLSIYFTLFHTLIQAFIFITLSLAFMNEAME
ncbi:MAG: F0F1 ATP synthase subunit A [Clostridiales bacterium]|nr:F0F1 ATP synthase subunit A [Clostridiales bacterium]